MSDSEPEPTSEETLPSASQVHQRARSGIRLLMGRQVMLQIATFLGGILLARALGPAQFGLYAIATYLVQIVAQFGDFGLAPSFIQRKRELSERDLQVGFTLQQALTSLMVLGLLLAAPWLARFYPKAPPETVWLVRALAFDLFLTSWRTMSALQLERHLRYDRLALIEVIEVLTYQGLAVGLALTGHGVWSLVLATLARGSVGTLLMYLAAPWRLRLAFDRKLALDILRFGVPFQAQMLSNQLSSWITPILVGRWIGPEAVGLIMWAASNGKKPLMLVENVTRVAFPHFSRIQNNIGEVERTITHYLTWLLLAAGWWFALLLCAGPDLVRWIYTAKWSAAVPAMTVYGAAVVFDSVVWVTAVMLNSMGQVNWTTRVVLLRSLLNIGISLPLVRWLGFIGVPIAQLVSCAVTVPPMFRIFPRDAWKRISGSLLWLAVPLLCAVGAGKLAGMARGGIAFQAVVETVLVTVGYVAGMWIAAPAALRQKIVAGLAVRLRRVQGRSAEAGSAA